MIVGPQPAKRGRRARQLHQAEQDMPGYLRSPGTRRMHPGAGALHLPHLVRVGLQHRQPAIGEWILRQSSVAACSPLRSWSVAPMYVSPATTYQANVLKNAFENRVRAK